MTEADEPLPDQELGDFWALGVPLEGAFVADGDLELAIRQGRVKEARSPSSMGTAETGWRLIKPGEKEILEDLLVAAHADARRKA